ncbi:MAG: hypothetical protein IJY57_01145 [Clostridia bacterium]|nr:hypothetical protein [Clostridia bacterium]
MAQTKTNKISFKDKMKLAKQKCSEGIAKLKADFKDYKKSLKQAKKLGYISGKSDYDKLEQKGAMQRAYAQNGYGKAMKDRAKKDKLDNKIQNNGRKKK